ncbi:MaoC/PaaZ C-terminal domain-containing protein [Micromonospora cathayae]|uniref:MaoC/PaaZ C-terminal domain-containing protein n=1 Tax=Micromonospora cathayae TaxID=3028804 RepID=A0ABY7ZY79_9ACTN|nr:MaoC/PaaZ C-terminal domain-containing protein [Micromonospora sp. HUAS 3]WDZ86834.1 MaoC/PaaZ C-terminal domain-containing protein [Micromonospora sp. HUAS 3]
MSTDTARSGTGTSAELFFEDLTPGRSFDLGVITVDGGEMVAFARRFDPQWYHVDEELARQSHHGGLIASGFYTVSLFMRAYVDHVLSRAAADASPGLEELRWLAPVRAGDRLAVRLDVMGSKPSTARPGLGTVTLTGTMLRLDAEGRPECEVLRTRFRGWFTLRTTEPEPAPSDPGSTDGGSTDPGLSDPAPASGPPGSDPGASGGTVSDPADQNATPPPAAPTPPAAAAPPAPPAAAPSAPPATAAPSATAPPPFTAPPPLTAPPPAADPAPADPRQAPTPGRASVDGPTTILPAPFPPGSVPAVPVSPGPVPAGHVPAPRVPHPTEAPTAVIPAARDDGPPTTSTD